MTAVEVSYTEEGPRHAPVVVLANSLGADRAVWDPQVPALAERFRVISCDTRGHGSSPVPDGPNALDDLAGWFAPGFREQHPDVVARMEAMIAGTPDEGYADCGAEDPATPPEHQQTIVDGIPGAELSSVSPGAHLADVEQPLRVTGALLAHLDAAGSAR